MQNEILVSVICTTYNHEKYIEKTLKSILKQNVDFKFEVIIHDDASTDGTQIIIKKYEQMYPMQIKTIIQKNNQLSQNKSISYEFTYPKCKGKYIALCEGDDYWCDMNKLKKQVYYLENHTECTFAFSNGYIEDQNNNTIYDFLPYYGYEKGTDISRKMDLGELLEYRFIPTASFIFRHDKLNTVIDYFKTACPTADLRIRLLLTGLDFAYYDSDKMVVYRKNVPNSATTIWRTTDKYDFDALYLRTQKIIDMLQLVNQNTNGKFAANIQVYIDRHIRNILMHSYNFKVLSDEEYYLAFKHLSFIDKCEFCLRVILNGIKLKCHKERM